MDTLNIDLFKTTTKKLIADSYFARNNQYSTNGYWMLQTRFEDKQLQKVKPTKTDDIPLDYIKNIAKKANKKMTITNRLHTNGSTIICEVEDEKGQSTYIDAYYLSYILNQVGSCQIFQEDFNKPLVFIGLMGAIVAIIMPIRQ